MTEKEPFDSAVAGICAARARFMRQTVSMLVFIEDDEILLKYSFAIAENDANLIATLNDFHLMPATGAVSRRR